MKFNVVVGGITYMSMCVLAKRQIHTTPYARCFLQTSYFLIINIFKGDFINFTKYVQSAFKYFTLLKVEKCVSMLANCALSYSTGYFYVCVSV